MIVWTRERTAQVRGSSAHPCPPCTTALTLPLWLDARDGSGFRGVRGAPKTRGSPGLLRVHSSRLVIRPLRVRDVDLLILVCRMCGCLGCCRESEGQVPVYPGTLLDRTHRPPFTCLVQRDLGKEGFEVRRSNDRHPRNVGTCPRHVSAFHVPSTSNPSLPTREIELGWVNERPSRIADTR